MHESKCVFENYLHDLGVLLRELSCEAKARANERGRNDFDMGYMTALHRVVSLMQQQADSFNLPLEQIAMSGLDPDTDLV